MALAEVFDNYIDPSGENGWFLVILLAWAISYIHNLLEDRGVIPALFKASASGGARPSLLTPAVSSRSSERPR